MSCLFCDIARGERPAEIVYEDEVAMAFRDINPQAPTHILVIPRDHITGPLAVTGDNAPVIGHLVAVAAQVAQQAGIAQEGYRLVMNQGHDGGQEVFHMHLHVLGGRKLSWPPG